MTDAIPKVTLDAETDQALALFRDKRQGLTGTAGRLYAELADSIAEGMRAQFPGTPGLGRIVMAVAQKIGSTDGVLREDLGVALPVISLVTIAGLAAEQLEREP